MEKVYYRTDDAILQFDYDDVVEKLPYYESETGTAEATALRDLLASPDHSITVPREQYRFAYLELDLSEYQREGSVEKRFLQEKDITTFWREGVSVSRGS